MRKLQGIFSSKCRDGPSCFRVPLTNHLLLLSLILWPSLVFFLIKIRNFYFSCLYKSTLQVFSFFAPANPIMLMFHPSCRLSCFASMAQLAKLVFVCSLCLVHLFVSGVVSTNFTITNNCNYTIWPGILSTSSAQPISSTGFELQKGESTTIVAPTGWAGRMWGRTHCSRNSTGNFSCLTGDCGSGEVQCRGSGGASPVTLMEFALDGSGMDYFDVSLVDGFNLPVLVTPQGSSGDNCSSTGCVADLNESCPPELEVTSADGETVGCISACAAFDRPRLCCTGNNSSPEACKPTLYSENMKKSCPNVYSYAYDDANSTFTCTSAADYLITFCPIQNIRGQVTVGDSLTAGDVAEPWVSPSGDFAFGFHQLEKKDLYLLAIWYNKIPERTIVWYANGDNPVPTRSKLELTSDRGLLLTSPENKEIWSSSIGNGEAAYGLMDDTGNFMITSTTAKTLWQSFEDPRDTLLPGQTLERGGRNLISRLRETNFSLGMFQFRLIQDGNGVLNFNNLSTAFDDAYYWTNTVDSNLSNAGLRIVFNESGYLYVLRASDNWELITPERVFSATEYYHRVILHFDGVLVQYSYPKNSNSSNVKWEVIFREPTDICNSLSEIGAGTCGLNGVCNLSEDGRAACACPPRFSLLDPNDEYGGCKPDFHTQFCEDDGPNPLENFEFIELANTDWPTANYERYRPYKLQDCQKACLQDYFCNLIVFRGSTCWKKKLPPTNGTQDERVSGRAFIKVKKGLGLPPPAKKNKDGLVLLVSLFLGGSLFLNFILFGLLGFCSRHFHRNKSKAAAQFCKSNLLHFSYMELVRATNGFNEELGRGSFGIVYKGLIELGNEVPIAVKKLDRAVEESEKEFQTEVEVIGQTHHKNLVKLIGFCDEGHHRLLVYEFMSNGSLSNSLFGDTKLSWEQRIHIAFGIARGLAYLHEECGTQIIHCDIKPQNILLDENQAAKIADFGLAKLLKLDQSRTFTAIRGTKGYVAPEWFRNSPVTPKVDVYSFGVLLLEIICCRRNVDSELSGIEAILIDWAYDCFAEDKLDVLVGKDEEAMDDMKKVERLVMVAIWCIQEVSNLRPTMKMVLLMLEGIVQVSVPPCPYPSSAIAR